MTDRDKPLRLAAAAAEAFPDGSMTVSGLRREIARGRLVIERVAGKDYTTLAEIDRMRELCRLTAKVRISGSGRSESTTLASSGGPSGSFETATAEKALAALDTTLQALKARSKSISPRSTPMRRRRAASVIQLTSSSRTF